MVNLAGLVILLRPYKSGVCKMISPTGLGYGQPLWGWWSHCCSFLPPDKSGGYAKKSPTGLG